MYYRSLTSFAMGCLLAAQMATAQEPSTAAELARLVDSQTIVVARVDLSQLDVDLVTNKIATFLGDQLTDAPSAGKVAQIGEMVKRLKQAGVRSVYFVGGASDLATGPVLVVPRFTPESAKLLGDALPKNYFEVTQLVQGMLVTGHMAAVERLKKLQPVERPELAAALAAAPPSDVQVIVLLNPDMRRVLRELTPLKQQGEQATAALGSIEWASVGLKLGREFSLDILVQTTNEQAAGQLTELVSAQLRAAAQVERPLGKLVSLFKTRQEGSRVRLAFQETAEATAAVAGPIQAAREAARRTRCVNHFRQLVIAMHAFHDQHQRFPAATRSDENGKPLLSWRVELLPYLEQENLYKQFHLDEPWDSEHNRPLIEKIPEVFVCPSAKLMPGTTTYVVPRGQHTVFSGQEGMKIQQITDGTSNTILLLEVASKDAVVWTKPDDVTIDSEDPLKSIGSDHLNGFVAGMADGSVRFFTTKIDAKTLRLLLDPQDGQPVNVP